MGGQRFAQNIAYIVVGLFAVALIISWAFPERKIDPNLAKAFLATVGVVCGNAFHVTFIRQPKEKNGPDADQ